MYVHIYVQNMFKIYAHTKRNNHHVPCKGGGFGAQSDKMICPRSQGMMTIQVRGSLL